MNNREIALSKRGTFASVKYTKTCKVLKNSPVITKTTKIFNARIGAEYDALKTTLEKKGVNNKKEAHLVNNGLRGMSYVVYPTILKSDKTGKEYVRLETNKNTRFETVYMVNGKEVDKSEIECYLQSSEKKTGEIPTVMNIGLDDITEIK